MMGASEKAAATYHPGPFADWHETTVEALPPLRTGRECPACGGSGYASTMDGRDLGTCLDCGGYGAAHEPRTEELEPGRGTALVCAADDEPWPCTHEQQLTQEAPDHE